MNEIAVYIHIPFCPSKCGYCDFNSYAMTGEILEKTTESICKQILQSPWKGRAAKNIFFGGGTPTFLESKQLERILQATLKTHPPQLSIEITSEANPGTVDIPKFNAMHQMGFNRISLGAQSFHQQDLIRLGRVHQSYEIGRAVESARKAGFDNINLDLMFGLPDQPIQAWKQNLKTALFLDPEHLSLYGLTLEPNTRFYKLHSKGMLEVPDDAIQAEMYQKTLEITQDAGYFQYEISNFSKPNFQCQHNLCYWKAEEYIGYGPGAVGCTIINGARVRYTNLKHPKHYIEAIENYSNLWCETEILTGEMLRTEHIMLGLRLNQGLPLENLNLEPKKIETLIEKGWIHLENEKIKLSDQGKLFCNNVILELI